MSDKNKWLKRQSELHPQQLLEKMNIQRCCGDYCDVTVVVQRMRFRGHKCVLSAASKKLHFLISSMKPCSASNDMGHELCIQEVSPQGFKILLEYIYTGSLLIPADCLSDVSTAAVFLEMEEAIQACVNFDLTQTDKEPSHEPGDGTSGGNQNTSSKLPVLDSASFGGLLNQGDGNDHGQEVSQGNVGNLTTQDNVTSYGSYPDQDALSEISVQNEDDLMYHQAGGSDQGSTQQQRGTGNQQSSSQYPYHHYVPPIEQTFSPRPMPKMLSTHMTILPGMLPSQAFFQDQTQGQFPVDTTYYLTSQAGQFYSGNFVQDQTRPLPEYSSEQSSQTYSSQSYQSGNEGHQRGEGYGTGGVQSQSVSGYQQPTAGYTGLEYGDNVHLYNDGNDIALVSSDRELQVTQGRSVSGGKDSTQQALGSEKCTKGVFRDKSKTNHGDMTSLKPTGEASKCVINITPTAQEMSSNPFIEAISPYNPDVEIGGTDPVIETGGNSRLPLSLTGTSQNPSIGQGTSTGHMILPASVCTEVNTSVTSNISMSTASGSIKSESATSVHRTVTAPTKSKESTQSSTSFSSRPAARMPPKKAGYRGIDSDYNKHFAVFSMQHSQGHDPTTQSKQAESITNGPDGIEQNNYKHTNSAQEVSRNSSVEAKSHHQLAYQQPKLASGSSNLGHPVNQLQRNNNGSVAGSVTQQSQVTSDIVSKNIQDLIQPKPHHLLEGDNQRPTVQTSTSKVAGYKATIQDHSALKSSRHLSGSSEGKHPQKQSDKSEFLADGLHEMANPAVPLKTSNVVEPVTKQDLANKAGLPLNSQSDMVKSKSTSSLPAPEVVHIQTKKMAASHAAKVANGMTSQQLSQTSQGQLQGMQLEGASGTVVGMELGGYRPMVGYGSHMMAGSNEMRRGSDSQHTTGAGKDVGEITTVDTASIDTQPHPPHVPPPPAKRPNLPLDQSQMYHPEGQGVEAGGGEMTGSKSGGGGNLTPNKNCNVADLVDSYIEDYLRSIDQGSEHQSPVKSSHYQQQMSHAGNQQTGSMSAGEGSSSYTASQTGSLSGGAGTSYSNNQTGTLSSGAGSSYTSNHTGTLPAGTGSSYTSFTHNSAYNYPVSQTSGAMQGSALSSNNIGYSVEDVSKTILNVLNQECFDDDSGEGSLQAKDSTDQSKKHQQESVPLTALLKMVPFHKGSSQQMEGATEGQGHLTQYAEITSSQENVEHLMQGSSSGEEEDIVPRFEDIESGSDDDSNYNLVIDFDKEIHEEGEAREEEGIEDKGGQADAVDVIQKGRGGSKKVPNTPTKTCSPSKGKASNPEDKSGSNGGSKTSEKQTGTKPEVKIPRVTKKVSRRFLSPMKIPRYQLTTDYREDPEARPGHKSLHRPADEIVKPPKKRIKLKLLMTKLQDDNLTVTRKMLQKKEERKRKIKYVCELCQREFWDRYKSFADHMQDHMQNELTFCNICGKGYKRMEDLSRHRAESHDLYSFQCLHCDQKFTNSLAYKKHSVGVHQEKKPFYCVYDGCGYRSEKFNELEKHLLVHSVDKQFACPHCSKRFSQPNGLRSHLTTCMNMQSYVCPVCSKTFNRQQGLKDHMFIHKATKSHVCKECGASFSDPRNLGRHARTHSNEKKYACKHCDLKFKFSNCLKRHITRKHPDKETVQVGKKGGRNKKEVLVTNYSAIEPAAASLETEK